MKRKSKKIFRFISKNKKSLCISVFGLILSIFLFSSNFPSKYFKADLVSTECPITPSITVDTTPPTNIAVELTAGKTAEKNSLERTLKITADGAVYMHISGDIVYKHKDQWIPFEPQIILSLTEGDGNKNIRIKLKDALGNISEEITKTFGVDITPPELNKSNITFIGVTKGKTFKKNIRIKIPISLKEDTFIFIGGDIEDTDITYEWIPPKEKDIYPVTLTKSLGRKKIQIKLKDSAGNESPFATKEIELFECTNFSLPDDFCSKGIIQEGATDEFGCPYMPVCLPCPEIKTPVCNKGETLVGLFMTDEHGCDIAPECRVCPEIEEITSCPSRHTLIKGGTDENGCPLPNKCKFDGCPAVIQPVCEYGVSRTVDTGKDAFGCKLQNECKTCPNIPDPSCERVYVVERSNDGCPVKKACQPGGDFDIDKDGLTTKEEIRYGTNPEVADTDKDSILDGDEISLYKTDPNNKDTDSDSLSDGDEISLYKTDPNNPDTDGDKLNDYEEIFVYKTDPNNKDTDGDKLNDYEEIFVYKTDPNNPDTDGDSYLDGDEVKKGYSPKGRGYLDTDGDKLHDYEEKKYKTDPTKKDTDGDTLNDYEEIKKYKTDPTKKDTDGDTLSDYDEVRKYKTSPLVKDTDGDKYDDDEEIFTYKTDPLDGKSFYKDQDNDQIDDLWMKKYKKTIKKRKKSKKNHIRKKIARFKASIENPKAKIRKVIEKLDTIGIRDSDGDGLSDKLEYIYKTDPFTSDTDKDSFSDGEEILEYKTDPINPESSPETVSFNITNWADGDISSDPNIMVTGVAPAETRVIVKLINSKKEEIPLGQLIVPESKKFLLVADKVISDGTYNLLAQNVNLEGKLIEQTNPIKITIDQALAIPPPQVEAVDFNPIDIDKIKSVTTSNKKPVVLGNTYYQSQVIASFSSVLGVSSIIADSPVGDFLIEAPRELEEGNHNIFLYAVSPEKIKSRKISMPLTVIKKVIVPESNMFFYLYIIFLTNIVFTVCLWGYYYIRDKKTQKKQLSIQRSKQ